MGYLFSSTRKTQQNTPAGVSSLHTDANFSVQDSEFIKILDQEWVEVSVQEKKKFRYGPKPVAMAICDSLAPRKNRVKQAVIKKRIYKKSNRDHRDPTAAFPESRQWVTKAIPFTPAYSDSKNKNAISINFFGSRIDLTGLKFDKPQLDGQLSGMSIAKMWQRLSHAEYEDCLKSAISLSQMLKLDDYGYCLLLNKIAASYYPAAENDRKLLLWFLLLHSSFDVKIGYYNNQINLLIPAEQQLFGVRFLTMGGKRYYMLGLGNQVVNMPSIRTYAGYYPSFSREVDFRIHTLPRLKNRASQRILKFDYSGRSYSYPVYADKNLVDYYAFYPQTSLELYFNAQLSQRNQHELFPALLKELHGKAELTKLNFLLAFVQRAFPYKNDDEQFHREKIMIPDEMLYYSYSDCDDRAVFFAYLVRELMGLDVVFLEYNNHVSTAVKCRDTNPGIAYIIDDKSYLSCDPTFLYAEAGMEMPSLLGEVPRVIMPCLVYDNKGVP